MPFSLNFVNFMGNFCKVFAAYKQVRDSSAFLYQIAEFLLFLSTTINVSVLTVSKNLRSVITWNMLNFMTIVYVNLLQVKFQLSR